MSFATLNPRSTSDLTLAVERVVEAGGPILLLFDRASRDVPDRLLSSDLHSRFLRDYLRERESQFYDLIITIRGESVDSEESFFQEVRQAIPLADYMASNYDALDDILEVEGLSKDPKKRTYWVWRHCDILFARDHGAFSLAFQTLASCAREVRHGLTSKTGETTPPWPGWSPQPVVLLLTGAWDVVKAEVSRRESPLFKFPDSMASLFPDLATNLAVCRVIES